MKAEGKIGFIRTWELGGRAMQSWNSDLRGGCLWAQRRGPTALGCRHLRRGLVGAVSAKGAVRHIIKCWKKPTNWIPLFLQEVAVTARVNVFGGLKATGRKPTGNIQSWLPPPVSSLYPNGQIYQRSTGRGLTGFPGLQPSFCWDFSDLDHITERVLSTFISITVCV